MNIKSKIDEEGFISISINKVISVCGFCGNHDNEDAVIEFNFRDQKMYYLCSQCKRMNEMQFGKDKPSPYPSIRMGR